MRAAPANRLIDDMSIGLHLRRFQDQRRISCAIRGLEGTYRLHIACIGNNGGHGLELIELIGHNDSKGQARCLLRRDSTAEAGRKVE